jgi:hypothetical protein
VKERGSKSLVHKARREKERNIKGKDFKISAGHKKIDSRGRKELAW